MPRVARAHATAERAACSQRNKRLCRTAAMLAPLLVLGACGQGVPVAAGGSPERPSLTGAWRAQIRFSSGAFADVKDLGFMYVFNAGGTMTESSNYDGAPPVPPAYGIWRATGSRQFEARYAFFATKAPVTFDELAKGGGWLPAGHGVLTEKIRLGDDGKSYTSTISYTAYDQSGKTIEGGGEGSASAVRMEF